MSDPIKVVNICGISPLRREATDRSEMLTQMLLGESGHVLDMTERWLHIRLDFDGYEGWVNRNEVRFMPDADWQRWEQLPKMRNAYASLIADGRPRPVFIPLAALLGRSGDRLAIPGESMEPVIPDTARPSNLTEIAAGLLGTPYLWGGRTDVGIDCSGLVQTTFLLAGYKMPRDAWQQHALGCLRNGGIESARPGDLLYFGAEGRITHVGFYEGDGTLLHAQGYVKRENLRADLRFTNPYPLHTALAEKLMAVQDVSNLLVRLEKTDH